MVKTSEQDDSEVESSDSDEPGDTQDSGYEPSNDDRD